MARSRTRKPPVEKIYLLDPKTKKCLAILEKDLWKYGLWLYDGNVTKAAFDAMLLMGPELNAGPDGRLPHIPRNAIPAPGFSVEDAIEEHHKKLERDRLKKLKARRAARAAAAGEKKKKKKKT